MNLFGLEKIFIKCLWPFSTAILLVLDIEQRFRSYTEPITQTSPSGSKSAIKILAKISSEQV